MDKMMSLQNYFESFDVPAFNQYTVPTEERMVEMGITPYPRISYEPVFDSIGRINTITASIWDRSTGWTRIMGILSKMEKSLSNGGEKANYDGGQIWLTKGTPWAQPMNDEDDSIRRMVVNIQVEYLSEV